MEVVPSITNYLNIVS